MNTALSLSEKSALDRYVAASRKSPILSREDELSLARRYRETGDRHAAERLILSNLRFVLTVAHKFRGYGHSLLDLVQQGNLGLVTAVKKFDPERGYRFISYAVWWIRAFIFAYVRQASSVVGGHKRQLFFKLRSTRQRLEAKNARPATREELAAELAVTPDEIDAAENRLVLRDLALDHTFADKIRSALPTPEEACSDAEEAALTQGRVRKALAGLDERERLVVEARILNEKPRTLEDVGNQLNVSRERVRQLEQRALGKLRLQLASSPNSSA